MADEKSDFRGVYRVDSGKFKIVTTMFSKRWDSPVMESEFEAAMLYDAIRLKLGRKSDLNFPEGSIPGRFNKEASKIIRKFRAAHPEIKAAEKAKRIAARNALTDEHRQRLDAEAKLVEDATRDGMLHATSQKHPVRLDVSLDQSPTKLMKALEVPQGDRVMRMKLHDMQGVGNSIRTRRIYAQAFAKGARQIWKARARREAREAAAANSTAARPMTAEEAKVYADQW